MKRLFVLLLLFAMHASFAQNLEKDTIQLHELIISNKKVKTKKIRYSSSCTFYEHFDTYPEIATLIDRLPVGYIKSVTLDVNNNFWKSKTDFKDVEMEFLFYEVGADGSPGKQKGGVHRFTVAATHSGKIEIDLSSLSIYNPGQIFISLKRITPMVDNVRDLEIHFVCGDKPKYTAYVRYYTKDGWYKAKHAQALKTTITGIVL